MKVLVVSNLYPPNAIGGYERLVAQLASGLARRGHQISVLTSDHGPASPDSADSSVERSLKLLVSGGNIYRPFAGSEAERHSICRHNLARLSRKLQVERPDAVLVGNLYFLDASIMQALGPVAERTVFLLTDIWMVHFADDAFLQEYFRRNVLDPEPGTRPLVPPDPPALSLDRLESADAWRDYLAVMAQERTRRRRVEKELADDRAEYLARGVCHLCGETSFVVQRAGPATLATAARRRTDVTCVRCGQDGEVRGALHALESLTVAEDKREVLLVVEDATTRVLLEKRYPECSVVPSVSKLADGGEPAMYRHAVVLERMAGLPEVEAALGRLSRKVRPGGLLIAAAGLVTDPAELPGKREDEVAAEAVPPETASVAWGVMESARRAGLVDPVAYSYWSAEYGYLGREYLAYVARVPFV